MSPGVVRELRTFWAGNTKQSAIFMETSRLENPATNEPIIRRPGEHTKN
jgi:hypothetical protein